MIHPTAVIHPNAKLDSTVRIGPHAVIDADVQLGADCIVGPHVYLTGVTTIGARNQFHAGCVIGDAPQDLKYKGEPTRVRIGDDNKFREHVTVNRATTATGETVIGSNNYLLLHSHVGHNCHLGDHIILGGGSLLAGHSTVQDRALLSGNCMVHQFIRIGTLAMMQGGAAVSKDLPPFTVATGINKVCGLNVIGLRRAGYDSGQRLELKRLYRALFRGGKNFRAALAEAHLEFSGVAVKTLLDFCTAAKRGVCRDAEASRLNATDPD